MIKITNMKLFLIQLKHLFLPFVLTFFLASCAILDFGEEENNLKFNQTSIKKNKCPITKIPSKTANYKENKKYILSIKKIEMSCKSQLASDSNMLNIVIQYKAKMELKTNSKTKSKDFMLPSIYIAIIDMEKETVLAKMKSDIEISSREDNLIVNKNKFRLKYESYKNLYIYFGLQ